MNFNGALHAEIQALKGCTSSKHKPYIAFANQLQKGIGKGIYLIYMLRVVLCSYLWWTHLRFTHLFLHPWKAASFRAKFVKIKKLILLKIMTSN